MPGGLRADEARARRAPLRLQDRFAFRGARGSAEHDLDPQEGDRLCPVTFTKANPACSWVVGGQTYYFCCPPCVTDFVRTAKNKPGAVKDPGEYRKRVGEEKR